MTTPTLSQAPVSTATSTYEPVQVLDDDELYDIVFHDLPLLKNIELMARAWQLGSPWGLMGNALGIAACDVPTTSIVTGTAARPVPLNLLLAMVGDPGMGKGATMSAPIFMECSRAVSGVIGGMNTVGVHHIHHAHPASGEKLIDEFYKDPDDDPAC